ncbi:MAG: hypothetical protein KIT31_02645 [Deltaproteobacteria bacterium]|nr:hypothetical protein [Deltaproteobacteria bacterium]
MSGTSGLTIPLPLSPGRAGFTPSLALTYDSGAGNGPYGLGWTIALPAITRRTDRGLPQYLDELESDVFLLGGAEDLVPALRADGSRHEEVRDGFHIRRYRPRVEGLFARIERWTSLTGAGAVHWRSISRTNVTTLYGKSPASRISDPHDASRIFSWLACESYDDKGHAAVYDYVAEDGENVDLSRACEAGRSAAARSANRYLKRVRYGNRTSRLVSPDLAGMDWMFELVMDFGDHDDEEPTPTPTRTWFARPDPFSTSRPGFEVRTYRRCRRFLMFHRFEELSPTPRVVRTLELDYADLSEAGVDAERELAHQGSTRLCSFLRRAIVVGHDEGGVARAMPPLELTYSRARIDAAPRTLDRESVQDLRGGVDGRSRQWLDLDGEGIAGVFGEEAGSWWYKQNLGAGRLGPSRPISPRPRIEGDVQFLDLAGDGQLDALILHAGNTGFYERDEQRGWSRFTPLADRPNLAWDDPNVRLVDLTGDGHADLLITEGGELSWHPSLVEVGFGERRRIPLPPDENVGPLLVFRDPRAVVMFVDMSGDGLPDLVRIRNGEVCYWPNLGYGRFGAKVVMDDAPVFDAPDLFDPARIRLADIDGSGVTDIVYLGPGAVQLYFNRAGNGFTPVHRLPAFPRVDDVATVTVTDLLGLGTACLVWSSPLPGRVDAPVHFIDLMGGEKPHLLVGIENNLGARTSLTYAASTKFYLADLRAGRPWSTRLPFPVHVLERSETFDEIGRSRFVRSYAYHDGYFDGHEREFRGFAEVEQLDTEQLAALGSAANVDAASHVPPVLTRTHFSTGAERGAAVLPAGLTGDEEREAIRALKGSMVRQEVYALDDSERAPHPYVVTAQQFEVRLVQPRGSNRHAVFFTHQREAITSHTERRAEDPRVAHTAALEVDEFGNVMLSANVTYGRARVDSTLASADEVRQGETHVTFAETVVTNAVDGPDDYRTPLDCEAKTLELTGLPSIVGTYTVDDLRAGWHDAVAIEYETTPVPGALEKRTIEHTRTVYRRNDLSGPLPLGHTESLALPLETYKLALTPGLVAQVFGDKVDDVVLSTDGRYVHTEGDALWWIPSGRTAYALAGDASRELAEARAHFFVPRRYLDSFGNATEVTLDPHDLLVRETRDALGNRTIATNDYRVLAPRMVTDPNGNRSAVAFDAHGFVIATAVMGKSGETQGDSLEELLVELPDAVVRAQLTDPLAHPHTILGRATTRVVYDLFAYQRTRDDPRPSPAVVYTLARETHEADLAPDERTEVQHGFAYCDGFGRTIQTKMRAEPGPEGTERWVASGWTVFDNKGQPVRKFEPFFSDSHRYESNLCAGVSNISFFDPVGRVIGVIHPDHSWKKVVFDAWRQEIWDVNDTVLLDPRTDADLGGHFRRLLDAEYLPTWHARRTSGTLEERDAAAKTAAHAATPTIAHLDSLGRVFLTIANTGTESAATRTVFDIEGNQRVVIDALDRVCVRYDHDMLGRRLHQVSMDAGERWMLADVAGKAISSWDSRGHQIRTRYDELRRPTEVLLGDVVVARTQYGEDVANAEADNVRGKPIRQFDQAGVVTTDRYDFKGNLIATRRQLARDYKGLRDWSTPVSLDPDTYTRSTTFDAMNRPIALTGPDASVRRTHYNEANLPERVDVSLRGEASTTPFITGIEYNARGQRIAIEHGNGARCTYTYDPETFRLSEVRTTRSGGAVLQHLHYTYDPAGNITHIADEAQQTIYFANQVVEATSDYQYDAIYRLIAAAGREHVGQVARSETTSSDDFRTRLAHPQDGQAMRRYAEAYRYDLAGNLLELVHRAQNSTWTRTYRYDASDQNRLSATTVGGAEEPYAYDAHGNLVAIPHLSSLRWNFLDQLEATSRQIVTEGAAETTFYVYDATGQRVRKVTERQNGTRKQERTYLDDFELFRQFDAGGTAVLLARETLLVSLGGPFASIETRTQGSDPGPAQLIRYQLGNHLGSATIELDADAQVISYEEYYPYGSTSYQAVRSQTETPKRYRYTGMERDDETGFAYHGARYYAPWLARWVACDPSGISSSLNLYEYCHGNPIAQTDRNGESPEADDLAKINRAMDTNHDKVLTFREVEMGLQCVNLTEHEWAVSMRLNNNAGFTVEWSVDRKIDKLFPQMSSLAQKAREAHHAKYGLQRDSDGIEYIPAERIAAHKEWLARHRDPQRVISTAVVGAMLLAPQVSSAFAAGVRFGEAATGRRSGIHPMDIATGRTKQVAGASMTAKERILAVAEGGIDAAFSAAGAATVGSTTRKTIEAEFGESLDGYEYFIHGTTREVAEGFALLPGRELYTTVDRSVARHFAERTIAKAGAGEVGGVAIVLPRQQVQHLKASGQLVVRPICDMPRLLEWVFRPGARETILKAGEIVCLPRGAL